MKTNIRRYKELKVERLDSGDRRLLDHISLHILQPCSNFKILITVPEGFITDYSSIPTFLSGFYHWTKVDIAGVFHDFLYTPSLYADEPELLKLSRREKDKVWRLVAQSGDHRLNFIQAWISYFILRIAGYWYYPSKVKS